jgi:uncharacterized short protein YbdD (DUF466 family)
VELRRWLRAVHWYLREVSGEADYDRYLSRHRELHAGHPAHPALSRADFERRRWEERANTPGTRCC